MAEAFKFELVSPARLLVSEEVDQVVVPGTEGYFTVLKGHAPFMSTVRPGVLEVTTHSGKQTKFLVIGGFADVAVSGLTVLAEQAVPVEEVTSDLFAKEIQSAETALGSAKSEDARVMAADKLSQLREVAASFGGAAVAAH
jgi:F-type H+-transporting ATPase subunit epsilon